MESNLEPNLAPNIEPTPKITPEPTTQPETAVQPPTTKPVVATPKKPAKTLPKNLTAWGSFFGILAIIYGSLNTLTIILAVIGIPSIIAGVKLLKAVKISKEIDTVDEKTAEVFKHLNSFFKINGILFIIVTGLTILMTLIAMVFGISMILNNQSNIKNILQQMIQQ